MLESGSTVHGSEIDLYLMGCLASENVYGKYLYQYNWKLYGIKNECKSY